RILIGDLIISGDQVVMARGKAPPADTHPALAVGGNDSVMVSATGTGAVEVGEKGPSLAAVHRGLDMVPLFPGHHEAPVIVAGDRKAAARRNGGDGEGIAQGGSPVVHDLAPEARIRLPGDQGRPVGKGSHPEGRGGAQASDGKVVAFTCRSAVHSLKIN